ncbi:putative ATP synthase K chain, mitochondrial [Scheffersomyces xylosifermentans]|uniref:putative ATP synthase K chain, mitochondrial n=1 Tax=Scheffersomyces xylosifermentans TaxID=1304137 RepID=UPI00315CE5DA
MAGAYTIFGRQVPAHVLSIATLASVTAIAAWPRAKSEAPAAAPAPVAASKEDDFDLEKFLNDLTKEETK